MSLGLFHATVIFFLVYRQFLSRPKYRWLLSSLQSHKLCSADFGLTRASNKECPLARRRAADSFSIH